MIEMRSSFSLAGRSDSSCHNFPSLGGPAQFQENCAGAEEGAAAVVIELLSPTGAHNQGDHTRVIASNSLEIRISSRRP